MSIISGPPQMVTREYELQMPIAVAVEKYAAVIQSTPDQVVNSTLKIVIWGNVECRRWRKQQRLAENKAGHTAATAAKT